MSAIRQLSLLVLIAVASDVSFGFPHQELPEDAIVPEVDMVLAQVQDDDDDTAAWNIERLKTRIREYRLKRDESDDESMRHVFRTKIHKLEKTLDGFMHTSSKTSTTPDGPDVKQQIKKQRVQRDQTDSVEARNRYEKNIKTQKAEQGKPSTSSKGEDVPTKPSTSSTKGEDAGKPSVSVKQQIKQQRVQRDQTTSSQVRLHDDKVIKHQKKGLQGASKTTPKETEARKPSNSVKQQIKKQRVKRDQTDSVEARNRYNKNIKTQKAEQNKHIGSTATFISTLESLKKQIRTLRAQRDEAGDAEKRDALKQKIEKKKVQREQMIRQHEKEAKEQEQDARKKAVQHAKQVKLAKQQKASYNKTHKAFAAALQGLSEKLQALRVKRDTAVDDETSESLTLQIRRIKAKRDQMEKSNPVDPNKY